MRRWHAPRWLIHTFVLSLTIAGMASASAPEPGTSVAASDEFAPGRILFQLTADAFSSADFNPRGAAPGRTGLAALDVQLAAIGTSAVVQAFDLETNRAAKSAAGLDRIFIAYFGGDLEPNQAAERLGPLQEIEYAEPDGIWRIFIAPNDPLYPNQWAHNNTGQAISYYGYPVGTPGCDTDTDQAWDLQTGSPDLVLAIIDTGCDLNHPEFSGRIVPGYDFVNNDSNPSDDGNHGTACAGIALAAGNNAQGVAGVAWQIKLMPIKVLNSQGSGTWEDVASGIIFAADNGARVLSMSLGGGSSSTVESAVNYAYGRGCALFCATGNENVSQISYPARYTNTIAVGAMSPCCERKSPNSCDGEYWWGSNYGTDIDFLAPGTRIHTTDRVGGAGYDPSSYFDEFNGTSAATPHAAGIGALVWSQDPTLTSAELRTVLRDTCTDLGSAGFDLQTGYGRLNAYQAVLSVGVLEEGACCSPDGACQYVMEAQCSTGDWHAGVECTPNPCPQPSGACCSPNGACQYVQEAECSTGDWRIGWQCFPSPCPQPSGACCRPNGACQYITEAQCATGDWRVGVPCAPNPCPQPSGACCYPDGTCQYVEKAQCSTNDWRTGVQCAPNPCPQPSGACCNLDGTCQYIEEAQCGTGDWRLGVTCEPNPCISVDVEAGANLPTGWEITRSVPNPFQHTTVIRYGLPAQAPVTIRIYDVSGNVVRTLVHEGLKGAGYHDATWDGTDDAGQQVESGVYFYRFETVWGYETATVVLIR